MTALETPEYRKLALDSSNEMMDHDGDRGLGRYAKAARHIREAGFGRLRMGQIMFDAGEFVHAAEDWLSAAACFYLVPDLERMREAFGRVQALDRAGHIPAERRDIRAAIVEREGQFHELGQKLKRFLQHEERMVDARRPAQEALDSLLPQLRELPGLPKLHELIAHQAARLGQLPLASEHLDWAEKFDPGNPEYGYLRVDVLIGSGEVEHGVQLGRALLEAHPEMHHLRTLLAQTIAFPVGDQRVDWDEAIRILRPLLEDNSAETSDRLMGLALAVAVQHEFGDEAQYRRLLGAFNQAADAIEWPPGREFATRLRAEFPQVFPRPGSNGAAPRSVERRHTPPESHYAEMGRFFRERNPHVAGTAA